MNRHREMEILIDDAHYNSEVTTEDKQRKLLRKHGYSYLEISEYFEELITGIIKVEETTTTDWPHWQW